ncbi:MAG: 2Fe-2S iron-sulfur cluster binding domain-containing protein [Hyphomonadaceae bacterium]|nr:MAG: ferredoxin 2Fe-2S [Caulobacteraceae bacterium]MBT9446509.1 2Fe-2S iron-sulfur cluster binding domain-containing protein [Hyphomonadaceae bacterium]TPW07937.1 MAG: ferredoxin, 2Fe-2S [Alphaproteobacteria bacterium]
MADDVRTLNVIDRNGALHTVEGLDGWRVMEIIRDQGLPIKAECGGACACATCHVYVDEAWLGKLVPPTDEEVERLDDAFEVTGASRLSCQILMREDFDGLTVTLAPGSEP